MGRRIMRRPIRLRRFVPQPLLGTALLLLGLCSLAATWLATLASGSGGVSVTGVGLALVLGAGAVLAQLYPVHIARSLKISTLTIPLFVLVALTPPALAGTSAGVALLVGEVLQRKAKGSAPSTIATAVGRWIVLVIAGSLAAHLPAPVVAPLVVGGVALPLGAPLARLPLLLAAAVLFGGDTLTVSLEIAAITGTTPGRIARMVLREGGAAEAMLYLIGLLATLAAWQDAWSVVLWLAPVVVLRGLLKRSMELHDHTRALLESMADAVDLRDPYTGGHSRRVTDYTAAILRALNVTGPEATLITAAARVHDIGKIAIPDSILNKPDRLTDEERAVMESHPQRGADFLARYPDFRRGVGIVLHHHERPDGKGYPAGLVGGDIPFGAAVVAVADAFDAMTSDRPYRKGMPVAKAAQILAEGRGAQWDGAIVDAFIAHVIPTLLAGADAAEATGASTAA
jgi:hypothetical protein